MQPASHSRIFPYYKSLLMSGVYGWPYIEDSMWHMLRETQLWNLLQSIVIDLQRMHLSVARSAIPPRPFASAQSSHATQRWVLWGTTWPEKRLIQWCWQTVASVDLAESKKNPENNSSLFTPRKKHSVWHLPDSMEHLKILAPASRMSRLLSYDTQQSHVTESHTKPLATAMAAMLSLGRTNRIKRSSKDLPINLPLGVLCLLHMSEYHFQLLSGPKLCLWIPWQSTAPELQSLWPLSRPRTRAKHCCERRRILMTWKPSNTTFKTKSSKLQNTELLTGSKVE